MANFSNPAKKKIEGLKNFQIELGSIIEPDALILEAARHLDIQAELSHE